MTGNGKRAIGAFVLGAAILIAGAIFLFAGADFFEKERRFVAYFEQSVNGLSVGAPVKFRGIPIGEVTEIEGVYNPETSTVTPRVILTVRPERMSNARLQGDGYSLFKGLVKRGMRGSLKSQSMLTGQLYVSLDFYEDEPIRRLGSAADDYPEMPTVETGLGEFLASIQELPIDKVVTQLGDTLASVQKVLGDEDLALAIDRLPQLIGNLDQTARGIDQFARNDLPKTTTQMRSLLRTSEASVGRLSERIDKGTLTKLDKTLSGIDQTLAQARERLGPNDPLSLEVTNAMRDVSETALALRRLAEYLETNPEALVRGRSK